MRNMVNCVEYYGTEGVVFLGTIFLPFLLLPPFQNE